MHLRPELLSTDIRLTSMFNSGNQVQRSSGLEFALHVARARRYRVISFEKRARVVSIGILRQLGYEIDKQHQEHLQYTSNYVVILLPLLVILCWLCDLGGIANQTVSQVHLQTSRPCYKHLGKSFYHQRKRIASAGDYEWHCSDIGRPGTRRVEVAVTCCLLLRSAGAISCITHYIPSLTTYRHI
jgi:hypothetical protein